MQPEDFEAYIEYFINEEKKGVKEYNNFLELLSNEPNTADFREMIKSFIKDEQRHMFALKQLL